MNIRTKTGELETKSRKTGKQANNSNNNKKQSYLQHIRYKFHLIVLLIWTGC